MKTPEFKKIYRDIPQSQQEKMNESLEIAALKGSQETHVVDKKIEIENKIDYQKELIKDYNQQIEDLEKKQNLAEDIFTIAKNPEKFIDIDSQSKEDIQKIINEIYKEKDTGLTLMNRMKIQLAKLKNIIPKKPQDN
jgi:hypothetical protein